MSIEQFPVPGTTGTVTSVAGGEGITNTPDPIVTTGTVDLDIDSLTEETSPAGGDEFAMVDVSEGTDPADQRKVTLNNIQAATGLRIMQSWTAIQAGGGVTPATAVVGVGTNANAGPSAAATASAFDDSTGFYINYATTTALNNNSGWINGSGGTFGTFIVVANQLPDITWIVKSGAAASDIVQLRWWNALMAAGGVLNADTLSSASGGVGFRFSPQDAGDTAWMASSSDGTNNNNVSTGVTVMADTRYVLRAVWTSTTSVDYYVNGVLTNTFSTNLPAASLALMPEAHIINRTAGTARNFRIRRAVCFST